MNRPVLQTVMLGSSTLLSASHTPLCSHPRLASLSGEAWPSSAMCVGSFEILNLKTLGIVCSVRLPGSIILESFDFAKSIKGEGLACVGGFHSPMERQFLEILLVRHVPLVICVGRRLSASRLPSSWRVPLAEGRLMLLSSFDEKKRRVTRDLAYQRNRFVAALSDSLLVPFATPKGKTEQIVREALSWRKTVWSFGIEPGEELFSLGVRSTTARELTGILREGAKPSPNLA